MRHPGSLRARPRRLGSILAALSAVWLGSGALVPAQTPGTPPARSRPPTALIAGVVVIADSGLPLDGVRVTLSGSEIRGSRRAQTDDDGRFAFAGLPAGQYTLSAARTGYVNVVFGQHEPGRGRQGTPIQVVEGQVVDDIRLSIPRGGVITGRVFDEKGRPSVGTPVRVSGWVMATGERRLTGFGTSTTDDRGVYRVYGLAPGAYVVHAVPRNQTATLTSVNGNLIEVLRGDAQAAGASGVQISSDGRVVTLGLDPASATTSAGERVGYAPVYYPGTLDVAMAQTVELGVSEERAAIDMFLQQVPLTTVSGRLLIPPGINMSNVRLRLVSTGVSAPGVGAPTARASGDGTFSFDAVAPGQYRVFAVASVRNVTASAVGPTLGGEPLPEGNNTIQFWAAAGVYVSREEVSGITLAMQPGMIVSGQVLFDGFSLPRPENLRRVRVSLTPGGEEAESGVSAVNASLDSDGRFRFVGVVPGKYRIRASAGAPGWWPKSAMVGGVDALDFPFEVPERDSVSNLIFTLADRSAQLSGRVEDAMSQPVTDFTVILFPANERYWTPSSRRIASQRPTTDGQFAFGGLPAGSYWLAVVTDVEPGAWYDPEFLRQLVGGAVSVSLGDGEQRVQSLRVSGR